MPQQEAELDPASRSIVARLRVIALVNWIMWTAAGFVLGAMYALNGYDFQPGPAGSDWYKLALGAVVLCSGGVGCFIGYLNKVLIDWARQVLTLLGTIAHKK
ncbi:MAG: hypothetical protein DUW69_001131 [Verrucomicrobia bacterium]|nr:MAG: hypothetical protein DUW69_001131 [Verrucomicrobiota bacterium]